MSDTEGIPVLARRTAAERTKEIDGLRTEIIRRYSQRADSISWDAMRELITSATLAAEEPFEHSPLQSRRDSADAALHRLRKVVEVMKR